MSEEHGIIREGLSTVCNVCMSSLLAILGIAEKSSKFTYNEDDTLCCSVEFIYINMLVLCAVGFIECKLKVLKHRETETAIETN